MEPSFINTLAGLLMGGISGGPMGILMAALGDPNIQARIGKFFSGFKFGGGGQAPAAPATFAGRPVNLAGFAGVQGPTGAFGHTVRPTGAEFAVPGAGGGTVDVSRLARQAGEGSSPFAAGALGRQAESAERFSRIDRLIGEAFGGRRAGGFQETLEKALGKKGSKIAAF